MCWFAGITSRNEDLLVMMAKPLHSRAIDDEYYYYDDAFSFYHAHLKISDLDKNTQQPFLYRDLVIWLVGEIYNKEYLLWLIWITSNLEWYTECHVIALLYHNLWEKYINYVNGEFAISIFDRLNKKYYFFRDRWGTNNLYYTLYNWDLCFASELKSLIFDSPVVNTQDFVEHMIFQFGISPNTIVEWIHSLRPGTYLMFENGQIHLKDFDWYISQENHTDLIQAIESAVLRRIPSFQKDIFVSLSGWPDSNLILFFLKKYFSGNIIAYSFFTEKNIQEIEIAKQNANTLGIKHLLIDMDEYQVMNYPYEHEWLVYLPNLWKILKEKYPEYTHVKVEFWWDGKEELINSNSHFPYVNIIKTYQYFRSKGMVKEFDITQEFLNREMFDYNLQMIDKITLRNGLERRLPFTDYELLKFKNYKNYREEATSFLKEQGLSVVAGEYGYNLGIGFSYTNYSQLRVVQEQLFDAFKNNL
jgi:asparagine synthase (glutamine-hydrolysing)